MNSEPLAAQLEMAQQHSMLGMDVPWLLDQWADRLPDKPFVIWEPFVGTSSVLTYDGLRRQARAAATGLRELGVEHGDFVLLHMENAPEFLITWFACALLGAVAVSANTRSVARDLAYFAEHTNAVCAVTQPSFAALVHQACPNLRFIVSTDNNAGALAEAAPGLPALNFADLLKHDAAWVARAPDPFANLGVQFTSGTTSRPKAVLWTHANAIWSGKVSAAHMRLRHEDIALVYLPLFHTNAQAYSMLSTLWCGGTIILQPKFSASRFWEVSLRHRATWLSTIPFTVKALEHHPAPPNHTYRFWAASHHMRDVPERFGIASLGWWGMTETLTQGIVGDVHHPGPELSIGRASPAYPIQIRKSDGTFARAGERGHLFIHGVRGVSLFKEYYRNPQANEDAFDAQGWFKTGDVIEVGSDGYLLFGDRDKDMLRVGGENVAASEIETAILQSGLVEECAVIGRPHPMLDEVPVAFVVTSQPPSTTLAQEVIEHCKLNLADFKVVREVHVIDSLPRGLLDKVLKADLREKLDAISTKLEG